MAFAVVAHVSNVVFVCKQGILADKYHPRTIDDDAVANCLDMKIGASN